VKILWVKSELLHPLDKGGRIRSFNMVKHLAKKNQVSYLCYADPVKEKAAIDELKKHVETLVTVEKTIHPKQSLGFYLDLLAALFSPHPYTVSNYTSPEMAKALKSMMAQEKFDTIICDFLTPSLNFDLETQQRSVLFQHNVEAQIWERHVKNQGNLLKKAYFYQEWKKLLKYEGEICRNFKTVIAVSREDRTWFEKKYQVKQAFDTPTGVDIDYFSPQSSELEKPGHIVFTGSMDWLPNEDAMLWFVSEMMPLLRKSLPQVQLSIVGRRPTAKVKRLALDHSDVVVTGGVEDVRPYMASASVFIVPIRIGGGTRLKIFEAMAMGKAVVSTQIGAEGLPVMDGEHLLFADSPGLFAEKVVQILNEKSLRQRLGKAAQEYVVKNYGWESVTQQFMEMLS